MIRRGTQALTRLALALPLSYLLVIWLPTYLNHQPQSVVTAATSPIDAPMFMPPPPPPKAAEPKAKAPAARTHTLQPLALTSVPVTSTGVHISVAPMAMATPQLTPLAMPTLNQGLASLSEVDTPPKLLHYIAPKMPVAARSQGLTGKVTLRLVVSETGEVIDARVQSAQPQQLFDDAALTAARRWRFKPAQIHNQPVSVYVDVPINFQIN